MATPSKEHERIAELCPSLLDNLKTSGTIVLGLKMIAPSTMCDAIGMLQSNLNKCMENAKRICGIILSENRLNRSAFLFMREEAQGLHKKENITKNTSLRTKAPRLCAKVGYSECMRNLRKVCTKDKKNRIVADSTACQCFGFTGTEHHFLKVWASLREFGTHAPLKTYGILRYDSINKGYKWDELIDFAEEYYSNYHAGLCKKDMALKRSKNEWFLKTSV